MSAEKFNRLIEASQKQEAAVLVDNLGREYHGQLFEFRPKAGTAIQFKIKCTEDSYFVTVDDRNIDKCFVVSDKRYEEFKQWMADYYARCQAFARKMKDQDNERRSSDLN